MSITFAAATPSPDAPELNISNANAIALLSLLGYRPEPTGDQDHAAQLGLILPPTEGEADPADILGRILLAQALLHVTTDDDHGTPAVTVGNVTDLGRRSGYFTEKLAELHRIATWAAAHHVPVTWY